MKISAQFDNQLEGELVDRLSSAQLSEPFLAALTPAAPKILGAAPFSDDLLRMEIDLPESTLGAVQLETIVRAFKRPSLLIQNHSFGTVESETWSGVLETHRQVIEASLPSVGRIELKNHPNLLWAGTGFLVEDGVVVTNRHVAAEFVRREGEGFAWKTTATNKHVRGRIDFREEHALPFEEEFEVVDVLHVEPESGPDLAIVRVEVANGLPRALSLQPGVGSEAMIATVGYPWRDSRVSQAVEKVMERIFGGIYNVKRLAPGKVLWVRPEAIGHDCTTLGGNSGSAVLDLETGAVVALHYGGDLEWNVAVPASLVAERLSEVA